MTNVEPTVAPSEPAAANETRSDVYCTNCGRTFVAMLDLALTGNHEITCPFCQHVHYRVVEGGRVTEERWRSSMATYIATTSTTVVYANVTFGTTATTWLLTDAWLNRSDLNLVTSS